MRRPRPPARGFSLVEVAVVAGVLGLLALTMTSAFEGMGQAREQNGAQAHAESARQALRHFMLRNKRLPCPDTTAYGDGGREAGAASACPAGVVKGWLPYESLGLPVPVRAQRLLYGVYRRSGSDLVAPAPAAVDGPDLEGIAGLERALAAAATAAPSSAWPHFAADGAAACTGTDLVNPAFVLVAPATDRDRSGGLHGGFDAPNRDFAEGSGTCVAAPSRATTAHYDDVVVAEGSTTLLGWLTASTR